MLLTTSNGFHDAVAWIGFIFIVLLVVEMATNLRLKIHAAWLALTNRSPSVDVAVQALMVEELNVNAGNSNADPTAPDERIAAANEYLQHRRSR